MKQKSMSVRSDLNKYDQCVQDSKDNGNYKQLLNHYFYIYIMCDITSSLNTFKLSLTVTHL